MLRIQQPDLEKLLIYLSVQQEFVFLDTSRPDSENSESLLFFKPVDRLICKVGDNQEEYMAALQKRVLDGFYLAGWVGYEFGALLEGRLGEDHAYYKNNQMVLADLGVFSKPLRFSHETGETDFPFAATGELANHSYEVTELKPNMERDDFVEALEVIKKYICAGDTYQVNYTMKLFFDFTGSVEKFYSFLRANQSVGYGAFIRNKDENILSFSPELFFKKDADHITVRPMKGTTQKGRTIAEEKENGRVLHHDVKNRSENVMIVDLLRNDLARLMHGHGESSVFVESLFDIESYESLLQMTSTIKAKTALKTMKNLHLAELFRALFPCGSITGAPKIRTMQIIDELEKDMRGVYTGAIGFFGPDGSAVFNVPIRTVRLQGNKGEMGIGAGITHDSVPVEEWEESLLKGRFLTHSKPAFEIFETILWQEQKGYFLLDSHLQRLEASASFFQFSFDKEKTSKLLESEIKNFDSPCHRIRLTLRKDGRITLQTFQCEAPQYLSLKDASTVSNGTALPQIEISTAVSEGEPVWKFHKTTIRELYNREYEKAVRNALLDYIFCNEKGELTEGCITNIIICKEGKYLTPPLVSGLLPGVMREKLLADTELQLVEEVLTKEDLMAAEKVFVCNSVRGVVPVELKA